MTGDTTVTATFALAGTVAELGVTRTGDGTGRVTSTSPAGAIDCGGVCTAWLPVGTVVTLRATPSNEAIFTGWGGACSGTGVCQVGLDASRAVEATFGLASAALTRYLAEGATSSFFDTQLALLNPGPTATTATLTFSRARASAVVSTVQVPARTRVTVNPKTITGLSTAEFSTKIESDQPLVVDRTLSWDVANGYGAHAETAVAAPALTWYLAEGATHSGFSLFYLLQNPNATTSQVRVRFLRPSGAPLEKTYALPANSRNNIWVNEEDFAGPRQGAGGDGCVSRVRGPQRSADHRRARPVPGSAGPDVRGGARERGRDDAGRAVVPGRRQHGAVLRPVRADRESRKRRRARSRRRTCCRTAP